MKGDKKIPANSGLLWKNLRLIREVVEDNKLIDQIERLLELEADIKKNYSIWVLKDSTIDLLGLERRIK